MPYTPIDKIPLPSENGSNNSAVVGQALAQVEKLVDGEYLFDMSAGSVTVDDTKTTGNNAVNSRWTTTGELTASEELIAPARKWQRFVTNNCTGAFTVKVVLTPSGAGIVVAPGSTMWLRCDGATVATLPFIRILPPYTVATLPPGTAGMEVYCTDLTTPSYLGIPTGGGAVTAKVFFNGTVWVCA